MMSVVSAMSVAHFVSVVTVCVLCLYLYTYSLTTDTTDINNLIVRARARAVDNSTPLPHITPARANTRRELP